MIFDSLAHASAYECLGRRYRTAFEWLRHADGDALAQGRYDIEPNDDVFALINDNALKPVAECRWEAHRKYADIQFVVRGVEAMGVGPIEEFLSQAPYDPAKDVEFFTAKQAMTEYGSVLVSAGHFAIFLPSDVHRPLMSPTSVDVGSVNRKIVIKVRV
jgi:YhcH/YjgK/YiaL family protein